jgi:hypothetical protein
MPLSESAARQSGRCRASPTPKGATERRWPPRPVRGERCFVAEPSDPPRSRVQRRHRRSFDAVTVHGVNISRTPAADRGIAARLARSATRRASGSVPSESRRTSRRCRDGSGFTSLVCAAGQIEHGRLSNGLGAGLTSSTPVASGRLSARRRRRPPVVRCSAGLPLAVEPAPGFVGKEVLGACLDSGSAQRWTAQQPACDWCTPSICSR